MSLGQPGSSSGGGGGLAARLATLQQRQQKGATQAATAGVDSEPEPGPDQVLARRAAVLRAREAQECCQPEPGYAAGEAGSTPAEYVQQLRHLLSSGEYPPVGCGAGDDEQLAGTSVGAAGAKPGATATRAELPLPDHIRRLLVLASRSLSAGAHASARDQATAAATTLDSLAAAADGGSGGRLGSVSSAWAAGRREAEQLQALAVVLHEAAQQQWLAVFKLVPPSPLTAAGQQQQQQLTAAAVQRAYRRLAGLIHPDKCSHACAEAGFKALAAAQQAALQQVEAGGAAGDASANAGADAADVASEYAWWSAWDADAADGRLDGAAAAAGGASRAGRDDAAAAADVARLQGMSMQVRVWHRLA